MASKPVQTYTSYQVIDASKSTLRTYLAPYLRSWPWYLLSLGLALGAAYAYLLYKQPVYRIQASLMLQDEKKGNVQSNPLKEMEVFNPKKMVENELEVLRSSTLMGRVVDNLHLNARYYQPVKFGKRELYADSPVVLLVESPKPALYKKPLELTFADTLTARINGVAYPLNKSIQTPYGQLRLLTRRPITDSTGMLYVQVMPRSAAVGLYLGNLKAEPTSKTSTVIRLTLEDAVPEKGEAVLNNLIREYNQAAVVDKNKMASSTLQFIEDRLSLVSGELAAVERNVENYKATKGITDLSTQAQAFLQTTQQNDAQLNQVNIKLAALNDLQGFINSQSDKRGSTPAVVGLDDPVLLGQIDKLAQLELKRDDMSQTTGEDNPLAQALAKQINETRSNIGKNVQTMKSMLTSSQRQYEAKNEKLENIIRTIPNQERSLMDITRQQTVKNELYTYLLQKREELAVSFAATMADTRTIDAAESSLGPVKPVGIVIYAFFALLSFLMPTAVVAGKQLLNTRVTRRMDVEDVTQVPILGEVMNKRRNEVMVVAPNSQTMIAEQIRTIRTNLQSGKGEVPTSQVVLFTSSISGEGKSFVSKNLGASMALLKQPTVILEMDLRMPGLHQTFGIDNSIGISNYLNGEATLDEILKPIPGYPNYTMIPSGPLPPDPSELLSGPYLKQLMAELRERFQFIIVDAPPIGIVTDAQIIAPFADTTLFVVRHGVTPKQSLKILDTLYQEQRFHNLSIILNAVGGNSEAYRFNSRYKNSYSYR